MRVIATAAASVLLSSAAFGAYYGVIGVPSGDVLSVRLEPDHKSKAIAKLSPDAVCVVHLGAQRRVGTETWLKVRAEGRPGWSNGRYLKPMPAGSCADSSEAVLADAAIRAIVQRFTMLDFDAIDRPSVAQALDARIKDIEAREQEGFEDAGEVRGARIASARACIAQVILQDDLKRAVSRCGGDVKPAAVRWSGKADSLTAAADVFPYFMAGLAYDNSGAKTDAAYYFQEVLRHADATRPFSNEWDSDYKEVLAVVQRRLAPR